MPPRSLEYALLARIGEHMCDCLVSVSKAHLQSILVLFDHMLHDPPGLWEEGSALGVDERWETLRSLSARAWLERYSASFHGTRVIGFELFKRQVRYLSQFYGRVLHPDTRCSLPVPTAHRMLRGSGGADAAGVSSSASSTEALSDTEELRAQRRGLVDLLANIRQRVCREPPPPEEQAQRVYAFSPTEVRRLVELACTTQEQLVLMLFLTTGLRLGGVARLRLNGPAPRTPTEVPDELTTTEKLNRVRTIHPTDCCRVLLARWYAHGRPGPTDSSYVFPCPVAGAYDKPVNPRYIWRSAGN